MGRRDRLETLFEQYAQSAGFIVQPGKSIRISEPVADKNGRLRKTVVTPDFYIIDPQYEVGEGFHIEVTRSGGNTPHKEAQQRVVDAAGVENYAVMTGWHIEQLARITPVEAYHLLSSWLVSIR